MTTVIGIIVAIVLAFLAFRFIAGMLKFGVIAVIVIAVIWFFMNGAAR